MSTRKIFTIAIIVLLAANLGLLAFIMMKPHRPNGNMNNGTREHGPKTFIIKRLGFDESQSEAFTELIKSTRSTIVSIDEQISDNKEQLFSLLGDPIPNTSRADSLTTNIAKLQKEIELLYFNHFQNVKALCKGEQIEKFNDLSSDLAKIFNSRNKKRTLKRDKHK